MKADDPGKTPQISTLEAFYEEKQDFLKNYLQRIGFNLTNEDREDLGQIVWQKFFEKCVGMPRCMQISMLARLAKAACIDHKKRWARRSAAYARYRAQRDRDFYPILTVARRSPLELHEIFNRIKSEDQHLLKLYVMEGWTLEEIENFTGISKSTANRKILKALADLRTYLDNE